MTTTLTLSKSYKELLSPRTTSLSTDGLGLHEETEATEMA